MFLHPHHHFQHLLQQMDPLPAPQLLSMLCSISWFPINLSWSHQNDAWLDEWIAPVVAAAYHFLAEFFCNSCCSHGRTLFDWAESLETMWIDGMICIDINFHLNKLEHNCCLVKQQYHDIENRWFFQLASSFIFPIYHFFFQTDNLIEVAMLILFCHC